MRSTKTAYFLTLKIYFCDDFCKDNLLLGLVVGQCLIAVLIELDADTVRPLCGNDLLDQFS